MTAQNALAWAMVICLLSMTVGIAVLVVVVAQRGV